MREFKTRPAIQTLSWETRFLYTLFLVFCLFNYILMAIIGTLRSGWFAKEVGNYFAGSGIGSVDEIFPKSFNELAELTHFHLFSISIFLLVKCHIYLLCAGSKKFKVGTCISVFAAAFVYMLTPWIVRFVPDARQMAWVFGPARAILLVCLLIMLIVPLQQMWFRKAAVKHESAD